VKPIEIFVRHDAELDALGYFQYLNERNPDAAERFLRAVDQTIAGLASQPHKGRERRFRGRDLKDIRSWRVDGFENYLIFYRTAGNQLEVLRIKHGAMKFPKALRRD
jgi:plasmid stabilization system protein ParE